MISGFKVGSFKLPVYIRLQGSGKGLSSLEWRALVIACNVGDCEARIRFLGDVLLCYIRIAHG